MSRVYTFLSSVSLPLTLARFSSPPLDASKVSYVSGFDAAAAALKGKGKSDIEEKKVRLASLSLLIPFPPPLR